MIFDVWNKEKMKRVVEEPIWGYPDKDAKIEALEDKVDFYKNENERLEALLSAKVFDKFIPIKELSDLDLAFILAQPWEGLTIEAVKEEVKRRYGIMKENKEEK